MMYDYDCKLYEGKLGRKTSFLFFSSTYCSLFPALVGNGCRIQDDLGFWIPRSGFWISGTGFQILCPRTLDSGLQSLVWPGFLDLYSGFQSPGFQISQTQFLEFQNSDSRFPFMGRTWKENDKKREEECLVDQHLCFAFSHLTVRERQRKLGKNRLENDQMRSARTICLVSVLCFTNSVLLSFFIF